MKCPFCGAEFDEPNKKCGSCPLRSSCCATCCPNCGYELSRESKLADLAQRVMGKLSRKREERRTNNEG